MKKWVVWLAATCLLVGCTTQLIYRNLDWFLLDYVDDYVELSSAQQQMVSASVERLSRWHRATQIPQYVAHIDELLVMDPKTFSLDDFYQQRGKVLGHVQRLASQAKPDIERLVASLSDQQVDEIMNAVRERHAKFKHKFARYSDQKLRQYYRDKVADNLEDWLGELTVEQLALLAQWQRQLVVTFPEWVDQQTRMRVELKNALSQRAEPDVFSQQFDTWLFTPDASFSDDLQSKSAINQQLTAKYLVAIIQVMTPKQLKHARAELEDWKTMAQELMAPQE